MKNETITMNAIPEPAPKTRAVLAPTFKGPVITGGGAVNYTCGDCGIVLLESVDFKHVVNIVVKCGGCADFNEISHSHHAH